MAKRAEYKTTTNRSVFNKMHKMSNASCSYCKWHGPNSENDAWDWYFINNETGKGKFPNWKLVSKNKKQWGKKSLKFKLIKRLDYTEIKWKTKLRPK